MWCLPHWLPDPCRNLECGARASGCGDITWGFEGSPSCWGTGLARLWCSPRTVMAATDGDVESCCSGSCVCGKQGCLRTPGYPSSVPGVYQVPAIHITISCPCRCSHPRGMGHSIAPGFCLGCFVLGQGDWPSKVPDPDLLCSFWGEMQWLSCLLWGQLRRHYHWTGLCGAPVRGGEQ